MKKIKTFCHVNLAVKKPNSLPLPPPHVSKNCTSTALCGEISWSLTG